MKKLKFTLNDVPANFELRLSDEFVDALDRLNRPWKYQDDAPPKRRSCQIWKAKDKFFKRLWGWSRYTRKDHDNGAFIRYSDIQENILNKTNVSWWFIEENVIGFRKGSCGKELKTRLPIESDKWWAKLMGFYWSSGGHWYRKRGTNTEAILRFNVDDAVIPMLHEIAEHIGDRPYEVTYIPVYAGPHKTQTLRSRVRQPILFSAATLEVLKQFGIPDPPENRGSGRRAAARNYDVSLPNWIRENDEYMHGFIESYVNGMRGHSMMHSRVPRGIVCQVLIRFVGNKEKEVKEFAEAFRDWFLKHGVTGYFRKMPDNRDKETLRYELIIHKKEGLFFVFNKFNIQRPDMRARLFLLGKANENYAVYTLIRHLSTQQIVLLGLVLEKPCSLQEIKNHLRMRPEMIKTLVDSMSVLILKGDKYHVDYSDFVAEQIVEKKEEAEKLRQKVKKLSGVLLYQCSDCGAIFYKETAVCEKCGGSSVGPINRNKILRPINIKRRKTEINAEKLSHSFLG